VWLEIEGRRTLMGERRRSRLNTRQYIDHLGRGGARLPTALTEISELWNKRLR